MDKIDILIHAIQIIIIPAASLRIMAYIISISTDPDNAHSYKRRIKNVLGFCIIAEVILPLILLANTYMS